LGRFDPAQVRQVQPPPHIIRLRSGDTLIEQGRPSDAMYVLAVGRLRAIVRDDRGDSRVLGDIVPGESVGEMSLLTGEPTSATVRAMHDSEVISFSRESFLHLAERSPEVLMTVARTVISRLRRGIARQRNATAYQRIAILPLGSSVDSRGFAEQLAAQLGSGTEIVGRDIATAGVESDFPSLAAFEEQQRRISAQLAAIEATGKTLLYPTHPKATAWTRACLFHADLLLLVGDVDGDPKLTEVEETLVARLDPLLAPRCDLVLLHGGDWKAKAGTAQWMAPRHVTEHHHLRRTSTGDFSRLARIARGTAVGLAFGGGGARGFSQIGVVRALREAGIPIDRVAGTSIGSLIGAQVAMGMSVEEMRERNRRLWIDGKPLSDYTFPAIALVRGRRLQNLIKNELAGIEIEDMPLRYFCVSGNLSQADLSLHDKGPLWPGVRASGSIPGWGPPMFYKGDILVDGGVLNNLPGDILRERFGGLTIVVDVSPHGSVNVPDSLEDPPSGWSLLWQRLNPFGPRGGVPSMVEILYRTATLSSDRMSKLTYGMADLVLAPPISRFGIVQFSAIDDLIEVGYRYACDQLERLDRAGALWKVTNAGRAEAAAAHSDRSLVA
jgi:NTE family protein/lysophospholipid hydrolase